jgi:hypothetical protein
MLSCDAISSCRLKSRRPISGSVDLQCVGFAASHLIAKLNLLLYTKSPDRIIKVKTMWVNIPKQVAPFFEFNIFQPTWQNPEHILPVFLSMPIVLV